MSFLNFLPLFSLLSLGLLSNTLTALPFDVTIPVIFHSFFKAANHLSQDEEYTKTLRDLQLIDEIMDNTLNCSQLKTAENKLLQLAIPYQYKINKKFHLKDLLENDCQFQKEDLQEETKGLFLKILSRLWEQIPNNFKEDFSNIFSQFIFPTYNYLHLKKNHDLLKTKDVEWNINWNLFYMKYAKGHKEAPIEVLRELSIIQDKWNFLLKEFYRQKN